MAEPTQGTPNGSADNGGQQPGNADGLKTAYAGASEPKPAAKPDGDNAGGGAQPGGEQTKLAPWTEQLPEDIRGNPEIAGRLSKFAKIGDMAKAYLEIEGKEIFPGKDAKPEDVASFWEKAGKPKSPDGYAFAKEQGGEALAAAAHTANLTAGQAEALYRTLTAQAAKNLQTMQEAQAAQVRETEAALQKEYGDSYKEKIQLLSRGLAAAGPNVAAILTRAGLMGNAEIAKAFIAFGQMTAESGATRGSPPGAQIKSVTEGGWYNYKDS